MKLKTKEADVVSAINEYLIILEKQGKIIFMRNNTGAVISEYKGKKRMWRVGKKGWSDFILWKPVHFAIGINTTFSFLRSYFLEVKSSSGKLLGDQLAFEQQVQRLGGKYYVVRSVEEVKQILL